VQSACGLESATGAAIFPRMSTLMEIEEAAAALPAKEKAELLVFITKQLEEEKAGRQPRRALLGKWRGRATGVVAGHGGTQGYLNAIRGRDEDRR
jgi:hypothetical protein